jgi:hypothetical protein
LLQILQLGRDVSVLLTCDDYRREKRGYWGDFECLLFVSTFILKPRDDFLLEGSERFGYLVHLVFKLFEQRS